MACTVIFKLCLLRIQKLKSSDSKLSWSVFQWPKMEHIGVSVWHGKNLTLAFKLEHFCVCPWNDKKCSNLWSHRLLQFVVPHIVASSSKQNQAQSLLIFLSGWPGALFKVSDQVPKSGGFLCGAVLRRATFSLRVAGCRFQGF